MVRHFSIFSFVPQRLLLLAILLLKYLKNKISKFSKRRFLIVQHLSRPLLCGPSGCARCEINNKKKAPVVGHRMRVCSLNFPSLSHFPPLAPSVESANQGQVRIYKILFAVTSIRALFLFVVVGAGGCCLFFPLDTNFPYTTVFHIVKSRNTWR